MTSRQSLRAAFYRGGTSKAVMFNAADLPAEKELRDKIFLHVMGSPDAYGRQLNGLGGGISSLSKVVILEPSKRDDADVDYTFVQIAVDEPVADYGQMCGNMSSAVGPFALEEGMVSANGESATVRIYNTNTGKILHATFPVKDGLPVEDGDFEIPGVSQPGAKVTLDFFDPGGTATGKLLPTGRAEDVLAIDDVGSFRASMVDASNPTVFIAAPDAGVSGYENPAELDASPGLAARMDKIRRAAAVAMGMVDRPEDALLSTPKVALVAPPGQFTALDGRSYRPEDHHLSVRFVSMEKFHRAVTLTGAMCVAVAARIPGTLINGLISTRNDILIGNPSGVIPVRAVVEQAPHGIKAVSATTFRTQRRIMEGRLPYPEPTEKEL